MADDQRPAIECGGVLRGLDLLVLEKVQDPTTQSVIYKCPEGTHEVVVFGIVIGCWFD